MGRVEISSIGWQRNHTVMKLFTRPCADEAFFPLHICKLEEENSIKDYKLSLLLLIELS